jgi:type II secretory pathway pseudopilin PulG
MSKQRWTGGVKRAGRRSRREGGFTMLQLLITVTIMGILGAFAFVGITTSRETMRIVGSARQFASYVEKARIDAVRRHTSSAQPSKVEFIDTNTYRVTIDFDGTGTPLSRDFDFENGISLLDLPPSAIEFDWRGRTTACTSTFSMVSSKGGDPISVDVTAGGDVTVDSDINDLPTLTYTNVNKTTDVSSDATVSGTTAAPTISVTDCSAVDTGPAGGATGTGTGSCTLNVNPSVVSIKKNGGTTGSFTVSTNTTSTVTAAGTSNLQITPTSRLITGGGSGTFTVRSLNSSRSSTGFPVTFTSPCTSVSVKVKVTN